MNEVTQTAEDRAFSAWYKKEFGRPVDPFDDNVKVYRSAWEGSRKYAETVIKRPSVYATPWDFQPNSYARNLEEATVQKIAEVYWSVATSNNNALASYQSRTYKAANNALVAAIAEVYQLPNKKARQVRNLVSEYGPHESLVETGHTTGVRSFVEAVRADPEAGKEI